MAKIYSKHPSGKVLETENWEYMDDEQNSVRITRLLSNEEENKYHFLKNAGATDSAIWRALRAKEEELVDHTSKDGIMQIELTIPLQELTKRQLILVFNKYAGYELPSMLSMTKDDIIKLIHAIAPSNTVKVNLENK